MAVVCSLLDDGWEEFQAERRRILADAQGLAKMASYYSHPEAPVEVDGFASARCYFNRPSASQPLLGDTEEEKEWEEFRAERNQVLTDAQNLKTMASFFLHPEAPVKVDAFATARCYFDRASAPQCADFADDEWEETDDEWEEFLEERRRVLTDAKLLKQMANFFLNPGASVKVDGFAAARCYFDRPSAPQSVDADTEWDEFVEERRRVLEDAENLKQMANFYHHPGAPVKVDGFATARCYFNRASAPTNEEYDEEWEVFQKERRRVLADAKNLKQMANFNLHPESPVEVDGFATARCYFDRASALHSECTYDEDLDEEWEEFQKERNRILEDAKNLKQMATFYLHPGAPVEVDGFATARCYFDRASAPTNEDHDEEWEEFKKQRSSILEDAKNLKQMASFVLHPEAPVEVDGFATARCYFDRASAPRPLLAADSH